MSHNDTTHTTKGASLARGPALVLGAILLIAGLYFLYKVHTFPKLSQFPSGKAHVRGKAFLGIFGVNGWSGELTAAAGGLLLFGAAQHLLAKTMSLIVGVVLAVTAVFALVDHHSAFGLFAANIWTIILWGGSAALLLVNVLLPRRTTVVEDQPETASVRTAPVATPSQRPVATPPERPVAAPSRRDEPEPVVSSATPAPISTSTSTATSTSSGTEPAGRAREGRNDITENAEGTEDPVERPAIGVRPTEGSVRHDPDADS